MAIKSRYEAKEDIPEAHVELFSERNGGWELTGVEGIRTQNDVDRSQAALVKEREEHAATKLKLKAWGDLDVDDTREKLDRIPELEAAAERELSKAEVDEIVEKRVAAKINTATAPLQRQIDALTGERDELTTERDSLRTDATRRAMHDDLRPLLREKGVRPEHDEDVFMYAERVLAREEGAERFTTRDGVGVTPGVGPDVWLGEILDRKPGWLAESNGSGGTGSRKKGAGGNNPFTAENWNLTEQARIHKMEGPDKAAELAKAAGTTVGGSKPAPKS